MSPRPIHPGADAVLARLADLLAAPGAWDPCARGPRGPSWDLPGALHRVLADGGFDCAAWGDAVYLFVTAMRARPDAGVLVVTGYVMPALRRFGHESPSVDRVLEVIAEARKAAPS